MADNFKWDDNALIPSKVTIDFSPLTDSKDDKAVEFFEFSRTDLTEFVSESLDLQVYETEEDGKTLKLTPETKQPIKRPFQEVAKDASASLFKFLALATRSKRKAAFFEGLPLTGTALAGLSEMLTELNHVGEVIAASGNWMVLPTMMEMWAEARNKKDESVSPTETSQA